jgi:hypothetical protein
LIEWVDQLIKRQILHMQVFQRVLQIGMSHQTLDQKQVGALLQVVGSKAMSECMRGVVLVDVRSAMACLLADLPHCRGTQVRTFSVGTFKEIVLRSVMQKVLSQDLQQNRRQWYLSLFQAFTLLNVYLHALAVDIGDFNVDTFRHTHSSGIDKHHDSAVLDVVNGLKDIIDLLGAEHQRKGFGHLRSGQVLFGPCFMVDVHKKKLERIVAHLHAARFVIAIGEHGLEISSQLVDTDSLRVPVNKLSIILDVPPIRLSCTCT